MGVFQRRSWFQLFWLALDIWKRTQSCLFRITKGPEKISVNCSGWWLPHLHHTFLGCYEKAKKESINFCSGWCLPHLQSSCLFAHRPWFPPLRQDPSNITNMATRLFRHSLSIIQYTLTHHFVRQGVLNKFKYFNTSFQPRPFKKMQNSPDITILHYLVIFGNHDHGHGFGHVHGLVVSRVILCLKILNFQVSECSEWPRVGIDLTGKLRILKFQHMISGKQGISRIFNKLFAHILSSGI